MDDGSISEAYTGGRSLRLSGFQHPIMNNAMVICEKTRTVDDSSEILQVLHIIMGWSPCTDFVENLFS